MAEGNHTEKNDIWAPPVIMVGDIWQEQDPRYPRFVQVVKISSTTGDPLIERVERRHDAWMPAARAVQRYAKRSRFNGKRGGYTLHHRQETTS